MSAGFFVDDVILPSRSVVNDTHGGSAFAGLAVALVWNDYTDLFHTGLYEFEDLAAMLAIAAVAADYLACAGGRTFQSLDPRLWRGRARRGCGAGGRTAHPPNTVCWTPRFARSTSGWNNFPVAWAVPTAAANPPAARAMLERRPVRVQLIMVGVSSILLSKVVTSEPRTV